MKRGKSDLNNDETNSLVVRVIAIFAISTTAVADGWARCLLRVFRSNRHRIGDCFCVVAKLGRRVRGWEGF